MKTFPRTLVAAVCAAFLFSLVGCAGLQKQLDAADPADKGNPTRQTLVAAQQATTNPVVTDTAAAFPYGTTILTAVSSILGLALLVYKGKSDQSGAKLDVLQHATGTPSPTAAVASASAQVTPPEVAALTASVAPLTPPKS